MKTIKSIVGIMAAVIVLGANLMLCSCTKEENGTIYGTVTDISGESISNANVKLRPSGETTLTGIDGTYEFKDLKAGRYSLSLTKPGYEDLDDDYVINLETGKSVRRDVQMRKQVASLQITDMSGNAISSIDFGQEESVTSKSFNIFNNGSLTIECLLSYNCAWIDTAIAMGTSISPGQTLTVTVVINRASLLMGINRTYLHIISNNGSNELEITATGYNPPTITTANVSNITMTSATCGGNVTSDGGTPVTDRGLCWATTNAPTIDNSSSINIGNGTGNFTGVISGLSRNTVYYIRAYATNQRGTAYGDEIMFTTKDGTPDVATINPTRSDTRVTTGGNITNDYGSAVTARGVCYSTTPYPDLSNAHSHTVDGSGTGTYSSTFTMDDPGVYYVRAYATNAYGTSYGEQLTINHPYNDLPTFTFNGETYRVAPAATNNMNWSDANTYCNNLTLYGYTDWRLPTDAELGNMYVNRNTIGGFSAGYWWTCTSCNTYPATDGGHSVRDFGNSTSGYYPCQPNSRSYFVRPIRVEN